MLRDSSWSGRFMGSVQYYEDANIIMVGVPMDYTTSYRPGARYGPQKIREVSYVLEEYSPYLDRDLADIYFFDAGDLELPCGNTLHSLEKISGAAREILEDGKKPFFIGGEHLISYPVVKEIYKIYGRDLILLHFDAHADLRDEYLGQKFSHATIVKRCLDFLPAKNVYQFGIRSGTREEFRWAKENTNFYPFEILKSVEAVRPELQGRPIYISLDIDVVDPAYAPGTGTPEPGGCTPGEVIKVISLLKDFCVVGADLVEVSPVSDVADVTSILGAKLIREAMLSFWGGR